MTSGTHIFKLDVEDLISKALDKVGGEITSGEDLRKARVALNLFLIELSNRGVPLAELQNRTLSLQEGVSEYTLDSDVSDIMSMVLTRDNNDTPITRISIAEFHDIPNKASRGMPTQAMIDRKRVAPTITLYLTPDRNTDVVNYWCYTRIEDAGAYTNDLDMSYRYFPALVFGLAYYISFDRFGFDMNRRQELWTEFTRLLESAALEDRERVSHKVTPFNYKSR